MVKPLSFSSLDYLSFEKGYIKKIWKNQIKIALVYPNHYPVGMSNLGFLSIYQALNSYSDIICERFFLPEKEEVPLSVENKKPLTEFDLIIFSISFELDYPNVIKILNLSRIPLFPEERDKAILGGGIALWLNPLPLLKVFDAVLLGEWEAMEKEILKCLPLSFDKKKFLAYLESLSFVYIANKKSEKVRIVKNLNPERPLFSSLISERAVFSNTYLVEISKGCGRGCRFCASGYVYRPPRKFIFLSLKKVLEKIPENSKVGLIGLDFLENKELLELGKFLFQKNVRPSFSSLRIDAVTQEVVELFSKTESVTLAPETGSEKIKEVINKPIPEEKIFEVLETLGRIGIKKVKFYFMLGLPFEEEEDIKETAQFIHKILKFPLKFAYTFSFSFFSPKPHTPFQWMPLYTQKELKRKKSLLERNLKEARRFVKFDSIRYAYLQSLIIRGEENILEDLISLAKGESLSKVIRSLEGKIKNCFKEEETLPWDNIETGIRKAYLLEEWKRAQEGKLTPFCTPFKCKRCGACRI